MTHSRPFSSVVMAIGLMSVGSPATTRAVKPFGRLIAFADCSGERKSSAAASSRRRNMEKAPSYR
jgi:hypothetical protein